MFENLQGRLGEIFRKIKGRGKLTEKTLDNVLREIRLALLEADVNYKVVKDFVRRVRDKAKEVDILQSLTPEQQVIKIVKDELVYLLGGESKAFLLKKKPTVVMLCGLQGSGKTTTAAKLALKFKQNGKSVLLSACDLQRAAAVEQLQQLGNQIDVPVITPVNSETPLDVAEKSLIFARKNGVDLLVLDTAGRLHIDEELMEELIEIKRNISPDEIWLVVDSMVGQDAVKSAASFNDRLGITGVILTKMDTDARGGAALSIKMVVGVPIYYVGIGEKLDDLEPFYPDRMASRIIGMGDVLSLIEKAEKTLDINESLQLTRKISSDSFDLEDLRKQMIQVRKLGSITKLLDYLPKVGPFTNVNTLDFDDRELVKMEAIINSMTPEERKRPQIINLSRKKRIAKGSGTTVADVSRLLKQFKSTKKMLKGLKKMSRSKKFKYHR